MSILFVLEHYYPYIGGAEKLFRQVAEALAYEGYEVNVLTTQYEKNLAKREKINGVQVHRVKCINRYFFTFFSIPKAWSLARNADFIHTTTYNAAFPAWFVGKLRRKKTVLTFHEYWGALWFDLPYLSILHRWLFYSYEKLISILPFDQYIAVSEATKNDLISCGIQSEKITRIYNGIQYDKFSKYKSKQSKYFTLIYYGRLGVSKGLDLIIPAWAQFVEKHPSSKLELIIPTKPSSLYDTILKSIKSFKLENSIALFHELEEDVLFQKVSDAHAVLIPSYKEGFCFVAAEAVALKRPIISSTKGALKEVVSGRFIEMEEHNIPTLANAMEKAFQNKWSISPIRRFTLFDAVKAYTRFYK